MTMDLSVSHLPTWVSRDSPIKAATCESERCLPLPSTMMLNCFRKSVLVVEHCSFLTDLVPIVLSMMYRVANGCHGIGFSTLRIPQKRTKESPLSIDAASTKPHNGCRKGGQRSKNGLKLSASGRTHSQSPFVAQVGPARYHSSRTATELWPFTLDARPNPCIALNFNPAENVSLGKRMGEENGYDGVVEENDLG